jgi:hypothetical protein
MYPFILKKPFATAPVPQDAIPYSMLLYLMWMYPFLLKKLLQLHLLLRLLRLMLMQTLPCTRSQSTHQVQSDEETFSWLVVSVQTICKHCHVQDH